MKDYERMLEDYQQQVRRRLHNNEGRTMKDYRWDLEGRMTEREWTGVVNADGYSITAFLNAPKETLCAINAHNDAVEALEKEIARPRTDVPMLWMPPEARNMGTVNMLREMATEAENRSERIWYLGIADTVEKMVEARDEG